MGTGPSTRAGEAIPIDMGEYIICIREDRLYNATI